MEPTAPNAAFQNGMAERPNQAYANMVRCLLFTAGLGPEFWSFALTHAVYIKNPLPHTTTNKTPYYSYTSKHPDASNLRIWGCCIFALLPGQQPKIFDIHTTTRIFLGYTATDKNIIYQEHHTKKIKTATHCTFDEAMLTTPRAHLSPAIIALQDLGYHGDFTKQAVTEPSPSHMQVINETSNTEK